MNLSKCIVESAVITDLRMGIIKGCKWKGFCICTFMLLIHLKLSFFVCGLNIEHFRNGQSYVVLLMLVFCFLLMMRSHP